MKTKTAPTLMALLAAALFFGAFGCTPNITDIDPSASRVGLEVTILGSFFGDAQGVDDTVTFNGEDAGTASSWSKTKIEIEVPTGAETGPVVVTVGGRPSKGYEFTVLDPDDCELPFSGGSFDLEISGVDLDCLDPAIVAIIEQAILDLGLSQEGVTIPTIESLPVAIGPVTLPLIGDVSFNLNVGTTGHCWEGSGGGTGTIEIDLDDLTGGKIPCIITMESSVDFTLDPFGAGAIWMTVSMGMESVVGVGCEELITAPCTISLEITGTPAAS